MSTFSLVVEMPRAMLAAPDGRLGLIHVYETTSLAGPGGRFRRVNA